LDQKVINYIKSIAIDMIDEAGSGHPGIVLSAAPIIYSVYANHLATDIHNRQNNNRDRFVLSAGHGSALLYATLHIFGWPLTMPDLKKFRQVGSKTPGHPEYDLDIGVETATGPLGQGVAHAVGMAIAAKYQDIDNKIYVLCSDGDLMEGVAYEALSLAGHLKLDNLIILYDANDVTLDGLLNKAFSENMQKRMASINFAYFLVENGENLTNLNETINQAKETNQPSLIEIKTIIGKGTSLAGSNAAHGQPLAKEDIRKLKEDFGISNCFFVPDDVYQYAQNKIMASKCMNSKNFYDEIDVTMDFQDLYEEYEPLRKSGGKILARILAENTSLIGGSADVGSSTKMYFDKLGDFSSHNYRGRNIWYGVREHAMGSVTNGIVLSGLSAYCSTFLTFADYMKPAIRLAALMNIPSIFVFTHDAINIGPDGPTHQPIEQLAMLRSTPNLTVFRPADIKEVIGAYQYALTNQHPSAIVLSRSKVRKQRNTRIKKVFKGAYIIRKEKKLHGILIATGSEVMSAVNIANDLYKEKGIDLRVVSMPARELFAKQSKKYQASILPTGVRKVVIEAGCSYGWEKYVYSSKYLLTIDSFGISGSSEDVLKHFKFDFENLKKQIRHLF